MSDNILLLTSQKFNVSILNCRAKSPERIIHPKTIAFNRRNFNHFTQTINKNSMSCFQGLMPYVPLVWLRKEKKKKL